MMVYMIFVNDDGDTEVMYGEGDVGGNYVVKHTKEDAVDELVSYGCSAEDARAAVDETTKTGEWVEV